MTVSASPAAGPTREGRVTAFDEPAGLGEVTTAEGRVHPFHCAAVADGSRSIALGAAVRFRVRPGLHGRWEADVIEPIG